MIKAVVDLRKSVDRGRLIEEKKKNRLYNDNYG